MLTAVELAVLVADVRRAQKTYFRTRSSGALEESKRLERRLDDVLEDLLRQPALFDREPEAGVIAEMCAAVDDLDTPTLDGESLARKLDRCRTASARAKGGATDATHRP